MLVILLMLKKELNYIPHNRLVKNLNQEENKLTFQSETLVVDWISFKFQDLDDSTKRTIANYLFKIGFNSSQESGKLAKPIKQSILFSSNNKFEVLFIEDNSYWHFSFLD